MNLYGYWTCITGRLHLFGVLGYITIAEMATCEWDSYVFGLIGHILLEYRIESCNIFSTAVSYPLDTGLASIPFVKCDSSHLMYYCACRIFPPRLSPMTSMITPN